MCIVGAGINGLKCPKTLLRNGIGATIYEARHRTGGRAHQSDKLGHLVDLRVLQRVTDNVVLTGQKWDPAGFTGRIAIRPSD